MHKCRKQKRRSAFTMKIKDIEVIELTTEWTAFDETHRQSWGVLKIKSDEDLVGISRVSPRAGSLIKEYLLPQLLEEEVFNVERLWHKMYQATERLGRGVVGIIGAVDVALWDLVGQALGQPVYKLLGGFRDRVPAYADGAMYVRTPDELAEQMASYVQQGFRDVKLHLLGETLEQTLLELKKIREAIGNEVRFMVDVHRQWDLETAIEAAKQFEPYDIYWLEEPVKDNDEAQNLALLSQSTPILIATGEHENTLSGCRHLMEQGGIKVIQADIISGGGFTAWRKIAALAEAFHVSASPHGASFPEISAHLVASVPNGLIVSAFPSIEPYQIWSSLYKEPLQIREGWIELSQRPGLGLEFDDDFISKRKNI